MAKGDNRQGMGGFGGMKPQLSGMENARMPTPMSNTNEFGEQKPIGWENLVSPTFGATGGAPAQQGMPQIPQMPQMMKDIGQGMGQFGNLFPKFQGPMQQQVGQMNPNPGINVNPSAPPPMPNRGFGTSGGFGSLFGRMGGNRGIGGGLRNRMSGY